MRVHGPEHSREHAKPDDSRGFADPLWENVEIFEFVNCENFAAIPQPTCKAVVGRKNGRSWHGPAPKPHTTKQGPWLSFWWAIDQYQVSVDKRSGIKSDPNRADDPEYIVRLVGQAARVSVETVRIVGSLPAEFADQA